MFNIYVGNLPFEASHDELEHLFAPFGAVTRVTILTNRDSGRSRGFGFVEMADEAQGRAAVEALNGQAFAGRELRIDEARPREART